MLCVALAGEICDRLDLGPQAAVTRRSAGRPYTVSVDAHERFGITTGVSAADRAATIRVLIDPASAPTTSPARPHTAPAGAGRRRARARRADRGLGDLCRLAGLRPAAAIIEVMNDDGSMARRRSSSGSAGSTS